MVFFDNCGLERTLGDLILERNYRFEDRFERNLGGVQNLLTLDREPNLGIPRGSPAIPGNPPERSHRPQDGARETRAHFPDDAR